MHAVLVFEVTQAGEEVVCKDGCGGGGGHGAGQDGDYVACCSDIMGTPWAFSIVLPWYSTRS